MVYSKENKTTIGKSFTVADLIDKLNELPESYKSLSLVSATDDGLKIIDKIEFTLIENDKENNKQPKMCYEIKISSELGIEA